MISGSIVLYHNSSNQVKKAIRSFFTSKLCTKLYLIDNSLDDRLQTLKEIDPRIEYIHAHSNIGYGSAHNIALKYAIKHHSKYHIILNPDIYFSSGVIDSLYAHMEKNSDIAHIMPKVLYPDGSIQYLTKLLPSPAILLARRLLPFKTLQKYINNKYELRFTGYDKIIQAPYLSGCFMFLRTKALKKIGLFDEMFFMYPEDIDLTRRIHEKFKTIYFPEVSIFHEHQKESFKNFKMTKIHILNMIKYFNKWGWIFDRKRKDINKKILYDLGYKQGTGMHK